MTDNIWTDSTGNHKAKDPNNWSAGSPQPGDTLLLPQGSRIDVKDDDLRGDPLILSGNSASSPTTLNLSRNATVTLEKDNVHSPAGVGAGFGSNVRANVVGHDTLDLSTIEGPGGPTGQLLVTANLVGHASLSGNFQLGFLSALTVSGNKDSRYVNNETDTLRGASATFATRVIGSGTILATAGGVSPSSARGSQLEFSGFVSGGQSVELTGIAADGTARLDDRPSVAKLDKPTAFHGTIDLHNVSLIDLVVLAEADAWTYRNDMLSIFNGCGKLLDKVHVVSDAPMTGSVHGLSVSFDQTSGDLIVKPGTDFSGSLMAPTT